MGFYVNCLSAEIHTDPFFHGDGGSGSRLSMLRCVCVFVCLCVGYGCVLMSIFFRGGFLSSQKRGGDEYIYIPVHMLVIAALSCTI